MNDKPNRYALAALKDRRATLAGEIVLLERQIRHRRESLVHVDATLHLLDPGVSTEAIPNKRPQKRIKLFRQGELGRMIVDALRNAQGEPLSTSDLVTVLLRAGGHGEAARPTLAPRVRGNLAYLARRGSVRRITENKQSSWLLV